MSDPIGDAFAGSETAPPDPSDSSGSLPGYGMNVGVPGAYASPVGDAPSAFHGDSLEMQANATSGTGGDGFFAGMDPAQQGQLAAANLGLATGMLGNARTSFGQAASQQQQAQATGPQPLGPQGQPSQGAPQQGAQGAPQQGGQGGGGGPAGGKPPPPPINQVSLGSSGGFLTADLTYADQSLVSAVAAAASGAGRQATLMAGTVSLSGMHLQAGGSSPVGSRNAPASALVFGSESGGAPQFGGGGHWFGPTVQAWAAANPPPVAKQPPPGGGQGGGGQAGGGQPGSQPSGQPDAGQQAVNQALDRSLDQWSSTGQGVGQGGGDAPPAPNESDAALAQWGASSGYVGQGAGPGALGPGSGDSSATMAQQDFGKGFDDSVWSGIGGTQTVGQTEAIPQGVNDEGEPLGSLAAFGDNKPDASNTPQQWAAIRAAEPFGGAFSGSRNEFDHTNDPALFDDSDPVLKGSAWF